MAPKDHRKHEASFCADVSKWADAWFQTHPELPFGDSDIESFARGGNKRSDLRFYQRKPGSRGKLLLMGEVKLPGTPLGRSAFDPALLQDSYNKATAENCQYFFTWNVEELAMFDRSIWDAPSPRSGQSGLNCSTIPPRFAARAKPQKGVPAMKTFTKVLIMTLAAYGLLLPAVAQPAPGRHRVDLKSSQLHDGANEIAASGGLKLIATVSNGKITGFQVKDQAGKEVHGTMSRAAAPGGGPGGGGPDKLCKAEICVRNKDGGKECWDVYVDCKIVDTLPKGAKL